MNVHNPIQPDYPKSLNKFWVRLLPIIIFMAYLNASVFLFAFGPWEWPVEDGAKLYLFLVLAHLALTLGYVCAATSIPGDYHGKFSVQNIAILSLALNLLLLLPTSSFRTGSYIPDIMTGLSNLGDAYRMSYEIRSQGGAIVEYIRILLSPILVLLMPLTFYYWTYLKPIVRYLSVFCILFFLAIYISIGTNKAVADFVVVFPFLILARHFAGMLKLNRRQIIITILAVIFASGTFASFFAETQISRLGVKENLAHFPVLNMHADYDNFIIRPLPDEMKEPVFALTIYLTQGYYGLYLSLEKQFVPMFGVGNSIFLYMNASKITGVREIEEMPYPIRISEDGWDSYGNWSSIYPWIASDVSFPGTVIVVFFIGWLFALSWIDTLKGSNPFSIAVFAQFLIMLFYFPANNQLMQSGETLVGFYGTLLLWLYTRKKYVIRPSVCNA